MGRKDEGDDMQLVLVEEKVGERRNKRKKETPRFGLPARSKKGRCRPSIGKEVGNKDTGVLCAEKFSKQKSKH